LKSIKNQLFGKKEILMVLLSKDLNLISKSQKVFFHDVLDHVLRMNEKLSDTKDLIETLNASYLARVNVGILLSLLSPLSFMGYSSPLPLPFFPSSSFLIDKYSDCRSIQ
jgi:hypothetical protein